MRITRFPSLSESQFLGCASAFVDSLFGELNSAAMFLRKLEGQAKGAAFAYEMSLDRHRYGALVVIERWARLVMAFGGFGQVSDLPHRVQGAEQVLARASDVIDAADVYTGDVVAACLMAYQSLETTFQQERQAAERMARLGPMLPDEFKQARRIFLEDLGARA